MKHSAIPHIGNKDQERFMKKAYIVSTLFFGLSFSQNSFSEDCNELLNLGYMNINHSVNSYDSLVSAYNFLCTESYSSASQSTKRGMNFSFDFLKKLTGNFGQSIEGSLTQTTWSKVCKDKAIYNKLSTYQSINSSEISSIAMSAWTECLAMNSRGLKANFGTTPDLTGLTGTLYWAGSSPIYFTGVDNNGLGTASCTVTYYDGKKYVTTPTTNTTLFKLGASAAGFNCKRNTSLDDLGRITADGTRLTFKTSEGKLDFDMSPITLTHVEAKQIDGIYQKLTETQQTLDGLTSQLSNIDTTQKTQTDQITSLTSATKFIFSNSCPAGWKDYGTIGFISEHNSTIGQLIPIGGKYITGWYWTHPRVCVRQ